MARFPPDRIVCLTEETVETLYLLGEEARIVGVTGYAVRPARVRREKPRVGAFTSADIPKILALEPDLVLTFSDLQADIAAGLIREGVTVHAFNQRTIAGILAMIRMVGAMVGTYDRAEALAAGYAARIQTLTEAAPTHRPRVLFEEWDDPMITGIGWVSELIEIAGGEDCFAHLRGHQGARDRIITLDQAREAMPEIIVGSWCGKKFSPRRVAEREGWASVPAVANGRLHEIKSPLILSPGPAALTDGLDALHAIIRA
ncbi:MAG: cobalamin-binding protein [Pseudomonadota bacterium]